MKWIHGVAKRCKCADPARCKNPKHPFWIRMQHKGDRTSGFGPVTKFAFLLEKQEKLPATRQEAEALASRVHDWLVRDKPMPKTPTAAESVQKVDLTGNDLFDAWIKSRAVVARLKKAKVQAVDASKLRSARKAFGALALPQLEQAQTFIDYTDGMLKDGYNIATPNRILATIVRPAVLWGLAQHPPLLARSPFGKYQFQIATSAENKRMQRCAPDLEARLLQGCVDLATIPDERGKLYYADAAKDLADFIVLAIDLGPRSDELFNLSKPDVDWQSFTLTLRRTKRGGETRMVPFNPAGRVRAILDRRRFRAGYVLGKRKLFLPWVRLICLVFDLPFSRKKRGGYISDETIAAYQAINLRLHDLRHEAATWWGLCEVTDASAEFLQGHRSQTMHGRYKHEQLQLARQELAKKVWPREGERARFAEAVNQ